MLPSGGAVLFLLTILIGGSRHRSLEIHGSPLRVIVGGAKPKLWVVNNPRIFGNHSGQELRRFILEEHQGVVVGMVRRVADLPIDVETLVIGGDLPHAEIQELKGRLFDCQRLILINPIFDPKDLDIPPAPRAKVSAFFGEFSQSPSAIAWRGILGKETERILGVGDFMGKWTDVLQVRSDN